MNHKARHTAVLHQPLHDSPYGRAHVRGVLTYYFGARLLSGFAGVVCVILLARHLSVRDYAYFATMAGLAATIGLLSSIGLEKAVTCALPQGRMTQHVKVLAAFIWRVLALRAVVLVAATAAVAYGWSMVRRDIVLPHGTVALGAAWIIGTNLFQFLALVLQSLMQQKILAGVLLAQWCGRLTMLATALLGVPGMSLGTAIMIMTVPELAGSALLLIALGSHLKHTSVSGTAATAPGLAWPDWRAVKSLMRHNYGYAWLIAPPQPNAMIVMAALVLSAPQVAAYGFFSSLVERFKAYLPLQFMLNLAEPVLVASYTRDRNFAALWLRAGLLYKANVVLLMLLLAWSGAVAPVLAQLLAGGTYTAYALMLPLLIAQVTLGSFNTILQVIVNSVGRSEVLTRSGSIALALMALCFAASMMVRKADWFLLTTPLVFEIINSAVTVYLLRKTGYACRWDGWFHMKVCGASSVAFLCASHVAPWWNNGWLKVLGVGIVAAGIFALALMLVRVMDQEDAALLKALVRRGTDP